MAEASSESAGAKRKRGAAERTSPDTRRSKRGGAAPNYAQTAALIQSAVNAVDAVQHADMNSVNAADFAALQKATADHAGDDHGASPPDAAAASSTAAAALGSMYPSIHVGPASAEESFAQESEVQDPSYNPDVTQDVESGAAAVGASQTNGLVSAYKPKPVVGSQEWHKLRKDNHKEGTAVPSHRHPNVGGERG
jgi:transcriptional regulator CBF1